LCGDGGVQGGREVHERLLALGEVHREVIAGILDRKEFILETF
jgi:hypothetical protein